MLISIDGACKRNGDPTCSSSGVAWIQTEEGNYLYKSKFETCSTSQRGELNGLLEALRYAVGFADLHEDIIIITDSEYLYNTVTLNWVDKWHDNNWVGATGPVKNVDMWDAAWNMLHCLNRPNERVFMQLTKGHLIHYTPGLVNRAMISDSTGLELYMNICSVAGRSADKPRIIDDFLRERRDHDKNEPPREVAIDWAVANTMADCIASYIVKVMDKVNIT